MKPSNFSCPLRRTVFSLRSPVADLWLFSFSESCSGVIDPLLRAASPILSLPPSERPFFFRPQADSSFETFIAPLG